MRLGITAKLFIAVLLTNVITAVAVGLGVREAFNTGFDRYVGEREAQRLTRLAEVFGNAYREFGSWEFLRGRDDLWIEYNHAVRPTMLPMRRTDGSRLPQHEGKREPPRTPPGGEHRRPPPGLVLDAVGKVVVGDAHVDQELQRRAITMDGATVGWLASPVRRNVFDIVDQRFREQVWRESWIAALVAMALAALVAWFVTRGLIAPVKRIARATRELADGNYRTRVQPGPKDEIGQLVEDFNRLGTALERNESLRRNFMADVSHELRTPISILKGEIEALQDNVRPVTPEALHSLHGEIARLGNLVAEIHDLSLADAGALTYRFEAVNLAALVDEALEAAAGSLERQGLTVETAWPPGDVVVRGDPQRLQQLVANLLANSLRYTDEGGSIDVSARVKDGEALLAWEDSAPGVPPEALPKLFDRFFRIEVSRNRATGGSGLGLAICRTIVEAHGGTIAAGPAVLGGLRIEVRLPIVQPAANEPHA